jgi:hypothetical protein
MGRRARSADKGENASGVTAQATRTEITADLGLDLVVFDTLAKYTGSVSINSMDGMTALLDPVVMLAKQHNCAVVLLHHNTKNMKTIRHSFAGSGAIEGTARSGILVMKDPVDANCSLMIHVKSNYAATGSSKRFRIAGEPVRFSWEDENLDLDDSIIFATPGKRVKRIDEAHAFLVEYLNDDQWHHSQDVKGEAVSRGISKETLGDASRKYRIQMRKGPDTRTYYALPGVSTLLLQQQQPPLTQA